MEGQLYCTYSIPNGSGEPCPITEEVDCQIVIMVFYPIHTAFGRISFKVQLGQVGAGVERRIAYGNDIARDCNINQGSAIIESPGPYELNAARDGEVASLASWTHHQSGQYLVV